MTAQDVSPPPGKYRLTVEDYLTLDKTGAFEGLRTELIEGDVIVMSPEYRPHSFTKDEFAYRLRRELEGLENGLHIATGTSILLSETSMPRPDITLTREPRGEGAIPIDSIALLIEVASTTLVTDQEVKAPLYAAAGIPEYWVVDVNERTILQMWSPVDEAYTDRREIAFGAPITAATIPGLTVETSTL